MKEKKLISIITPTFNHEEFIGKCIDSVLNQSYSNWEQIIIDDGSTDKTKEIVLQYNDSRIRYFRQENVGIWKLKDTYNKALLKANGELIAILEGDDYWPKDKLEKQICSFMNPEVGLSWGKAFSVNGNNEKISMFPKSVKTYNKMSKEKYLEKLLIGNIMPACTVMCKKEALISIGGFKQHNTVYVDRSTWLELCLKYKFIAINEILGYRREHEKQISATMILEMAKSSNFVIDFYEKMPINVKKSVNLNLNDLKKINCNKIANSFFYLGIISLAKKDWNESHEYFQKAYKNGSITIKLKSIFGLISSRYKLNTLKYVNKVVKHPIITELLYNNSKSRN